MTLASFFTTNPTNLFFLFVYFISFGLIALYIAQKKLNKKIIGLLTLVFIGLVGVTLSKSLLTFFIFWEFMLISSYPLVKYKNEEGAKPGLTYLFISGIGVALLFFSLSFLYSYTGGLSFKNLAELQGKNLVLVFSFLTVSFLIEAVIVPFHFWAPKVYQTSSLFIVAFFASLLSKAGIFGILNSLSFIGPSIVNSPLTLLALISMTFANYLALIQKNLKRLFAFGSIAHLSFIVYALSLGTLLSLRASLFHVFNHSIITLGLFLSLDSLSLEKFSLKSIHGIAKRFKIPNLSLLISSLAAGGMPPFNLFFSELMIVLSSIKKGLLLPTIFLVFNMFLALVVFLRVVHNSLKGKKEKEVGIAKPTQKLALLIIDALILVVGIYPQLILGLLT